MLALSMLTSLLLRMLILHFVQDDNPNSMLACIHASLVTHHSSPTLTPRTAIFG